MRKIIPFLVALVFGFSGIANAQVKDRKYKDWTVFKTDINGSDVCYITSFPKSKSGNYKLRDAPYFMVTYIGEGVAEVSASSGYKYASGKKVDVKLGNKKMYMFTDGEIAWANDRQADKEFIATMGKQTKLTVKGYSASGAYSIDTYSLSGFSEAYNRMKTACK